MKTLTAREITNDVQQSYKEVSPAYLIILKKRIRDYAEQRCKELLSNILKGKLSDDMVFTFKRVKFE